MARNWLAAGFSRTYRRVSECSDRRRPIKRSERQEALACESLEGRVVLSDWGGGSLLASLNYVGVVTSPVVTSTQTGDDAGSAASQSAAYQQLNKDLQTLATEFQTLAGNSLVTVADLQSLATDTQAIAQAGFHFNSTTLQPVISELATAVVTPGSSTTTALNDFTALFGSSSGVSSTVITTTFTDLVTVITHSGVATGDLTTVAAEQAAIQTDLSALSGGSSPREGAGEWLNSFQSSPVLIQPFGEGHAGEAGSSLLGSLTYVGVVTSPVETSTQTGDDMGEAASQSSAYQQLNTDRQTLATEFQKLAGNSLVTVADLQSLATDTQAIAQAGFHFSATTLQPVISELATAVVTPGSSTTTALNDFTALFGSSSSVSSTVITTTFNDLVKVIGDSAVAPGDLTTVATEQAAIQTDLNNLHGTGASGGDCNGSNSSSGSTSATSGTITTSGSGSTSSSGSTSGTTKVKIAVAQAHPTATSALKLIKHKDARGHR